MKRLGEGVGFVGGGDVGMISAAVRLHHMTMNVQGESCSNITDNGKTDWGYFLALSMTPCPYSSHTHTIYNTLSEYMCFI